MREEVHAVAAVQHQNAEHIHDISLKVKMACKQQTCVEDGASLEQTWF